MDDSKTFLNRMVNLALFKSISPLPPHQVAQEMAPLGVVTLAATVGLGGYGIYRACTENPDSPAVTPHVYVDTQNGHRISFAEFNRSPKAGEVENVRSLASLYNSIGAILTTQDSPHSVDVLAASTALSRLASSDNIQYEEQARLVLIRSYLPKVSECSSRKISSHEESELSLLRNVVKDVLFDLTVPVP